MNDLMSFLERPPPMPLEERAQRIRDLVGTARVCIIEIGRELIAAKAEVAHGKWLPWLDREFGWKERTAEKYMRVAGAFKSALDADFNGLTIDATALYALSAPAVPQEARDEAKERAEAGEHITKEDAEAMVEKAVAEKVAAAIAEVEADHEAAIKQAIEDATEELATDKKKLAAEIKKIKAAAKSPDTEEIARVLCAVLKIPKLAPSHWRLMAQLLDKAIAVGGKRYLPISREKEKANDENLRMSSVVTEAVQAIAAAPPAGVLLECCMWAQRELIRDQIGKVIGWARACETALKRFDPNEKD